MMVSRTSPFPRVSPDRLPTGLLLVGLMAAGPRSSAAQLRLSTLVGDRMGLQRDASVPVWGWAAAGDDIAVNFDGHTYTTTADATGSWKVTFPPHAAGGPYELTVVRKDERVEVRDVLVGDVWICSGQSNMEDRKSVV